ncbi:hypothetical protein BaRGS_00031591 [Batillaria attramentaria]|uniref:Uncharacterized protein n=1 Tax=Batillaria attramentaria TaxID=370345 RepID=A0ABD0JQY9_9CAEN
MLLRRRKCSVRRQITNSCSATNVARALWSILHGPFPQHMHRQSDIGRFEVADDQGLRFMDGKSPTGFLVKVFIRNQQLAVNSLRSRRFSSSLERCTVPDFFSLLRLSGLTGNDSGVSGPPTAANSIRMNGRNSGHNMGEKNPKHGATQPCLYIAKTRAPYRFMKANQMQRANFHGRGDVFTHRLRLIKFDLLLQRSKNDPLTVRQAFPPYRHIMANLRM